MFEEVFDYVVVGGGSAGAIVASRLASSSMKVLLLEAGGTDRRPDVILPAGVVSAYQRCNWKYPTEPDPTRNGRYEIWTAGKVLGGGGSINSCVYVRGNRADFDGWKELGCDGWDYDSVLPAFKRVETWEGGADAYRGGGGPISVRVQGDRGQANTAFVEAARQAGHPDTPDYNGAEQEGVAFGQVNHRRGTRSQSSREYLRGVAPKRNLKVQKHAFAQRISVERQAAVGVEYVHHRETKTARVREEVILCAGAIGSPKLLMLSGIGPRDQLERLNIAIEQDLPGVGENLQEHAYIPQRWHSRIPTINHPSPGFILDELSKYVRKGAGMLALTMVQGQVFCKSDLTESSPDLQLHFVPFAITHEVDENGMFDMALAKQEGFIGSSTHMHPRARGTVRLRSPDPAEPPLINFQFFADEDDLRDSVRGAKVVQEIMAQRAMTEITGGQFEPESRCSTDADWANFVRTTALASYHPVGTAKMGVDDLAVVDPQLRVHGIVGLRVADASIMPKITTGNTNVPSMMIGERAAQIILNS